MAFLYMCTCTFILLFVLSATWCWIFNFFSF